MYVTCTHLTRQFEIKIGIQLDGLHIFFSRSFSRLAFFHVVTEFTPFPDFPLYKTLPSRLCHAAGPRSVNLSLPHSQAFVSDSRTQGWHCRGRVAEGLRHEGGRRRGRLACTVFLVGEDGKGECRRVCEPDRAVDEIAHATVRGGFEAQAGQRTETSRKKKEGVADGTGNDDGDRR